ncbi:MAG: N-acyl-D-amino-acid deacylase [Candidatus Poriferisodalaceae bacterium]
MEERWHRVLALAANASHDNVGRTIADLAKERNADSGWDTLFDLMIEEGLRIKGLMLTSEAFAEEDNRMVLEHPLCSVESNTMALANDGPLAGPMMSVLGFNWVPRFLGHYVRDEGILIAEEGVRRLTGLPAGRLGLHDRGHLKQGYGADVVVFDLARLRDNSSFEDPTVYADGIDQVFVNGALVFNEGLRTGEHGGRVLRPTT